MEVNYMVLCCMLLATTAFLSAVNAVPDCTNENLSLDAQGKDCKCENGRCFTDKEGHRKCACKPGFSLLDEFTCKPCDCGSLGNCVFVLKPTGSDQFQHQKKCVCNVGCAEKDGVCVACDCGENSECDLEFGEKRCFCMEGYSEKDGVCSRCDCGFFGNCEYEKGKKICECDEGYLELNGACEECDCGDYGTCSFENAQRTCHCLQGFELNNEKCEQCDCGDHGTCFFENGRKTCRCQPGFVAYDGVCQPCDCGPNSEDCDFFLGNKQCKCKHGYADKDGTCEECYCGAFSMNCNFNNNRKTCSCMEGYMQKGETCGPRCSVEQPCQNGGYCKNNFCTCPKGTKGDFCEVIDECSNLCPNTSGVKCSYDVGSKKAYCKCLDSDLRYDPKTRQCRGNCMTDYFCINGKCRDGFCDCIPGTSGDRCEMVDCVTGAISCQNRMTLLWKGEDTLFLLWKGKLMKFIRQSYVFKYLEDFPHVKAVQCTNSQSFYWSAEYTIYIRTPQNEWLRYLRVDATGERCDSSK